MRRLFAIRDLRLLLAGQTLSMFGDRALFLALGIWVKTLTGSSAAAGMVFFVIVLPALFAPLGGFVVDRLPRRALMIGVDAFIGLAVLLLLFVRGPEQVWLIYIVAGLYGASAVVFDSAQSALLVVMLPEDLLAEGNAAFQTMREGLRLVAPLAGAGLFAAFGGGAVALVDAVTFGLSALCLLRLRVKEPKAPPREEHLLKEMAAGIRHILRTPPLRQIVITVGATVLVVGFTETLVFAVIDQGLHRAPSFLGVVLATQGVGAIAGGLTAARAMRRLGDGRLVACGIALFGVGAAALASTSLALVIAGVVVGGAGISWLVVGFGTAIQRRTPLALQGRVYSAADAVIGVPQTISIALGAALVAVVDYRLLIIVMCGVTALAALYLATRRPDDGPEAWRRATPAEILRAEEAIHVPAEALDP